MRDVEHRRAAVAAVGEEEAAAGREALAGPGRRESHVERDAGERRVPGRLGGQRRQGRVGRMDRMAEPADELEAGAVAAGAGQRQAAGGERSRPRRRSPRRSRSRTVQAPSGRPAARGPRPGRRSGSRRRGARRGRGGRRAPAGRCSRRGRACRSPAPGRAGCPTSSSKKRRCSASGQERSILRSVFGEESVTKRAGSSCGGQDVAPPAAAHQDLAPAVAGALEEQHAGPSGGEDRRDDPGRSGADDDDGEVSGTRSRAVCNTLGAPALPVRLLCHGAPPRPPPRRPAGRLGAPAASGGPGGLVRGLPLGGFPGLLPAVLLSLLRPRSVRPDRRCAGCGRAPGDGRRGAGPAARIRIPPSIRATSSTSRNSLV